jgi:hypothetical protein
MQQLDRRIATLRLRLAEIRSQEDKMRALQRQFSAQVDKVVEFAIRENSDLEGALNMLGEVDARQDQAERALRHLAAIRARAQEELDALVLTRSIEIAKAELAALEEERRHLEVQGNHERLPDLDADIRRLRQKISDASEEAARTVSARLRRPE